MPTRLEEILKKALREGDITTAEMIAIYGAVEWCAKHIDRTPWTESYGTMGSEALDELTNENS